VTLSVPSAGSTYGSVGPIIARQSDRRVSAQNERSQSVERKAQSPVVAIVFVEIGEPRESRTLS
jgi:hypothetical protein